MLAARGALYACGGLETLWGLYSLCCTQQALPGSIGRTLAVDAAASSPALLPTLAYGGALRVALGLVVLVAVATPTSAELVLNLSACVAAHACVLQPYVATMRSHERLPIASWVTVSLMEGAALTGSVAFDVDFEPATLLNIPAFIAIASFFVIGLILSLVASVCSCVSKGSAEVAPSSLSEGLLFDSKRHQLSPASKKFLA